MKKLLAILLCIVFCLSLCPTIYGAESEVAFYVSNGATGGDGSIENPFGTLKEAQMAIREYKQNSQIGLPKGGITVYIRGGEYFLTEGIEFTAEDSGEPNCPITYTAYNGEEVTFIGGVQLDGNAFVKTTDEEVLNRIYEEEARSHIMEFDLKSMGITEYGELDYPGAYPLKWLEGKTPAPELFYNDDVMTLARYPNGDEKMTVGEIIVHGPYGRDFTEEPEEGDPNFYGFTISYTEPRIDNWAGVEGIKMQGNWVYNWADTTVDVKEIDSGKRTITSVQPPNYGIATGQPFYAYNLIEELDTPGEYYLDRSTGILYFYPPSDDMNDATILLSLMEDNVFTFSNAEHITFDGFKITAVRNHAGAFRDTNDYITFRNMTIMNTSALAALRGNATNLLVDTCQFINVNGGLDITGGSVEELIHSNNTLTNSYFRNFARHKKNYNPAVIFRGCGSIISHNEMHDAPHSAILGPECEDIIEYNEIYDVCLESSDAAAIYWGSDPVARGSVIRYNYIHDIHDPTGHGYTHALYADDCDAGHDIFGNIFENVSSPTIMINGGHRHNIRNNIFINCNTPLWGTDAGLNLSLARWTYPDGTYIVKLNEDYIRSGLWLERYPEVATLLDDEPKLPKYNYFENNVMVNSGPNTYDENFGKLVTVNDNVNVKGDPGFVNFKNGNYSQTEDFVGFTQIKNFAKIDFENIGRYGASASSTLGDAIVLIADSPYAYVNGEKQAIDKENPSVAVREVNGRTLVPIRFITETFGAIVKWDEANNQVVVKYRGNSITFPVGENVYYKNDEAIETEAGAINDNGHVLVPLRAACESLSKNVYWNEAGLVAIYSSDADVESLANSKVAESIINILK